LAVMDTDDVDIVPAVDPCDDPDLVKWVSQLLIQGNKPSEIRRRLTENALIHSRFAPSQWKRLIRAAEIEAQHMRDFVMARAELEDVDWQRLDSYRRRVKALDRLEDVVEAAHGMADSVSHLNQVSFMVAGLLKAQDGIDQLTGAAKAQPVVQVNLNYDPLEQMRHAIQGAIESKNVIDVLPEPVDSADAEAEPVDGFWEEE